MAVARTWLLKKRLWIGVAIAGAVLVGINIPKFWQGPGGGGGGPVGLVSRGRDGAAPSEDETRDRLVSDVKVKDSDPGPSADEAPATIRVVIAERSFSLRTDDGERPIEMDEVVRLVKRAGGDIDGIRLRIYRKPSSRPSAETALQNALTEAGIPEEAILWVPAATE